MARFHSSFPFIIYEKLITFMKIIGKLLEMAGMIGSAILILTLLII